MSGTIGFNSMERIYKEQKAIDRADQELRQKPIEVIKRYKTMVEYKWKNRSLIARICTFSYVPVRYVAANKILDEQKLEEKVQ